MLLKKSPRRKLFISSKFAIFDPKKGKMNESIKLPLRSLNPGVVRGLQEKYPAAVVSIEIDSPGESTAMDEQQFWNIIALLDWGRKRIEDIIAPAIETLTHYSVEDIYRFEEILANKLHALDGEVYALPLGWGQIDFSVDGFLYARCCAVANGQSFFEKVRENPSFMPKEYTFEPILYLAEKAYRLKTGSEGYDFLPTVSYETFSNEEGWSNQYGLSKMIKG